MIFRQIRVLVSPISLLLCLSYDPIQEEGVERHVLVFFSIMNLVAGADGTNECCDERD